MSLSVSIDVLQLVHAVARTCFAWLMPVPSLANPGLSGLIGSPRWRTEVHSLYLEVTESRSLWVLAHDRTKVHHSKQALLKR